MGTRSLSVLALAIGLSLGSTGAMTPPEAPNESATASSEPRDEAVEQATESKNSSDGSTVALWGGLSLSAPYATGDCAGARPWLADQGVTWQLYLNSTYQWNVKGGRRTGGHHGATIDWLVSADLDRMGIVPGGRALIHVKREWGLGVNPFVGSLWQVQDDQDGDRELYIDQLWYEQDLIRNRLWVRIGYLDYQTIVDRSAFANSEDKQFMNQALDNNPLLPLQIGLGAALTWQPCEAFSLTTGIADAFGSSHKPGFSTAFHDEARFVWFTEPAVRLALPGPLGRRKLKGNYRFGLVYDPRSRPMFAPAAVPLRFQMAQSNDFGFYTSFDQELFHENDKDAQGLGWFFRYGFRHGDINRIGQFWSTGLSYQGLVPTRDRDVLGVAAFQSIPSRLFNDRVNRLAEAETGLEVYYAIEVAPWLVITPDLQYISSPGIESSMDDAIVLGVRTRISF